MPVKQASAVVAVAVVQSIVELLSLLVVVAHLVDSATHPVRVVTIVVDLEWADSNLDAIGLCPVGLSIVVENQNLHKLIWKSMLVSSSLVHHDFA